MILCLNFVAAIWGRPFPVSAQYILAQKEKEKKSFPQFSTEECDWPAQSSDLDPINPPWDGLFLF